MINATYIIQKHKHNVYKVLVFLDYAPYCVHLLNKKQAKKHIHNAVDEGYDVTVFDYDEVIVL